MITPSTKSMLTRRLLTGIAFLLAMISHVSAADEPSLRFQKDIPAVKAAEETLVAVPLDAEVYDATRSDLADLRLRDSHGTSVPFLVRKAQELRAHDVRRNTWNSAKPALRPLDNGGLEITLVLAADDPQPDGLRIVTPLRDFEQRVSILTSADGAQWQPAGEAVVFDYSRYMDVRNDDVPFPASTRKHVRIVIDDVTAEQQSELMELMRRLRGHEETERVEKVTINRRPFRIERIEFWQEFSVAGVKGDMKRAYPIAGFKVANDAKTGQTIVTIDTRREPLTSLKLQTSSRNFSRNCAVEIAEQHGVKSTWRAIGNTTLSQMNFKSLKREQLEVTFPESRQSQYRLVIDNRDSAPLEVTGITAEGNSYEVVFLSATNTPHQLAYGDPEATAPKYDTATLQALLKERFQPESVTLGEEQQTVGRAAAGGFKWSIVFLDVRLLMAVIALLVVLLGFGLYTAIRRIDDVPPPTTPSSPSPPAPAPPPVSS